MISEQEDQLGRTSNALAPIIASYYEEYGIGHEFTLHAITLHVMQQVVCSPTSPYRVMAEMKKNGQLNYVVLNRAQSLYKIVEVYDEGVFDFD